MDSLSYEQKKNMLEAFQTYLNTAVLIALGMAFFGDTPNDDAIKKWYAMWMVDNIAQQYNPVDIGRSLANLTPIGFKKSFEAGSAMSTMIGALLSDDPYTEQGHLRGSVGVLKSIPYVSSYYKIVKDIQSIEVTNGEEKTRNIILEYFSSDRVRMK
jgi:hypothetical protein